MDKFEVMWRKMAERVAFHKNRYSDLTELEKEFCQCMLSLEVTSVTNSNVVSGKEILMRTKPYYTDYMAEQKLKEKEEAKKIDKEIEVCIPPTLIPLNTSSQEFKNVINNL